jgi:penicillin amidase
MIHIGFSQPGTWYEAHIVTPEFELYGVLVNSYPLPWHRDYAWFNDVRKHDDRFISEENNLMKAYKTPNGFERNT